MHQPVLASRALFLPSCRTRRSAGCCCRSHHLPDDHVYQRTGFDPQETTRLKYHILLGRVHSVRLEELVMYTGSVRPSRPSRHHSSKSGQTGEQWIHQKIRISFSRSRKMILIIPFYVRFSSEARPRYTLKRAGTLRLFPLNHAAGKQRSYHQKG